MSRRAECASPTCNSWTGISGNMPTSRRRSPWATRSPALHTRSVGSCPKWRDFRRETTWLSRPDGAMASAAKADLDAIIDCAGAEQMMQLGFSLLAISGHYVDVGLVGDRVDIPLFPRVSREQTFHGSYWGNNTDLTEVMALAAEDKIRHTINIFRFDQINEHIELLRAGEIVGRAVMKF